MLCVTVPGSLADVAILGDNNTFIIVWQPPENPNGKLLGYTIRVYPLDNIDRALTVDKEANDYYHVLTVVPRESNLRVQVP